MCFQGLQLSAQRPVCEGVYEAEELLPGMTDLRLRVLFWVRSPGVYTVLLMQPGRSKEWKVKFVISTAQDNHVHPCLSIFFTWYIEGRPDIGINLLLQQPNTLQAQQP